MACPTLQNDRSLERPEKWKRQFLKTNGMFYSAERQEPRAPRKIETPLSEDQWHVYFAERQDLSVRRPERLKRYFLNRNGMFDCSERQKL